MNFDATKEVIPKKILTRHVTRLSIFLIVKKVITSLLQAKKYLDCNVNTVTLNNQSVSIIEDDSNIRESLRIFIESQSNLEIKSEHDRVETFLNNSFATPPNILLLDIGLPGISGLEGLPKIKKQFPNIDVIMLTTYEEEDIVFQALCAGACSYISK